MAFVQFVLIKGYFFFFFLMVREDVVKLLKTETIEVFVLTLACMHAEVTAITFGLNS